MDMRHPDYRNMRRFTNARILRRLRRHMRRAGREAGEPNARPNRLVSLSAARLCARHDFLKQLHAAAPRVKALARSAS